MSISLTRMLPALRLSAPRLTSQLKPLQRTISTTQTQISNLSSQTVTLSSGRTLGFSECGPRNAPAVFFLHGNPSSRIEGLSLADSASAVHARIITPDRSGIGLSSPQPSRTLLSFPPPIVTELADHLGLKEYRVLGGSAGGAYALACAYAANGNALGKLKAVGVLAGMAPPHYASHKDLRFGNRLAHWLMLRAPGLMGWVLHHYGAKQAMDPDPGMYRRFMEGQMKLAPKAERDLLMKSPESFDEFLWISRECFRQGVLTV